MNFHITGVWERALIVHGGSKCYHDGPQAEVNSLLMKIPQMGKKVDNDKIFSMFYKFEGWSLTGYTLASREGLIPPGNTVQVFYIEML